MADTGDAPRLSTAQRHKALSLVEQALELSRQPSYPTSRLVEDAARVARLIGDYTSLTWLELELRPIDSAGQRLDVQWELRLALGEDRALTLQRVALEHYLEERAVPSDISDRLEGEDRVDGSSAAELEAKVRFANEVLGMLGDDLGTDEMRRTRMAHELILSRIRTRVVRYLSREERVLGLSDDANAMFDQLRAETDMRLGRVCPDGLVKFAAACRAFMQHHPESASHALTSCRRLIKAVADALYPASTEPATGADGSPHDVGDEEYINRLVQWVYENHPRSKERRIVVDALHDLHARLTKLNDLASKGVHDEVADDDIRFGLIQTYLTIGEVLRFSAMHDDAE